ncbi:SDR family NAD(P)-dependent oxidoreductase [Albimonas pacifica]|uniref:NADP-dependent 3-hydroxy acid dehydrogenase YdfG n=1 Tax=Albimonas pacifica TaxID=1114924 RepID=A0A1I3MC71_9RHOB|nr:SDR family NAD(P)-dependent oxidoreductase [Albimonas pacifica]SFI94537.1 NADP-dependent 3-hydroxy acid dehydrogenase YdfG [Albimonas pacifica]
MTAPLPASVAILGAGSYIGAAIARRFAQEGYAVHLGRRNGDELAPLLDEIRAAGGRATGRSLDARQPEDVTAFLEEADAAAPLDLCLFNVGGNVRFPLTATTDRVFRKVWEMGCFAGFVAAREAARIMVPRGRGSIFLTGATASLRGGSGFSAFAAAKFGLRAVAQSAARELGPQGIHVAHLVIDAGVDTRFVRDRIAAAEGPQALETLAPDRLMNPASIAETYLQLHRQPRDAWTFETELRPYAEKW